MNPRLKSDLAHTTRRLHAAGWCANHDGNASVRLGRDRFLCTPTAVSKADVDESMLIVVDPAGKVLEGSRKAFGEFELHAAIYRARPDANVVLHAHPPYASAFGVAGVSLEVAVMPEVLVSLGRGVPTVPFHLPKTPGLVRGVEEAAKRSHAFLVAGNGAFAMGVDLEQAFLRLELVEHYAKIVALARQLGGVREMPAEDTAKMLEARAKAGLEPPGDRDPTKAVAPLPAPVKPAVKAPVGRRYPARAAGAPATDLDAVYASVVKRLGSTKVEEGELQKLVREELERAATKA